MGGGRSALTATRRAGPGSLKERCAIQPKVFVGNLSFETTDTELREMFSAAGEVVNVSIPTDRMGGRPRGFAFVEFASPEHATAAIEQFNGKELRGRNLRVDAAGERPSGPRPPGSGGPSGFGGFTADRPAHRARPKGSRRNIRSRKRSVW
jgi:cold-inducible RNA-binding protein